MDQIQCVSLPRSGHNMLVKHLQRYFASQAACPPAKKKRISLLDSFGQDSQASSGLPKGTFHYCEYYYACRSHPCRDKANRFQKSHDFDLLQPVHVNQKYIVQKRNPIDLLISWFEMRLLKRREVDSPDGVVSFCNQKQPYVDGFIEKWVDSVIPKRMVIDYDNYLESPVKNLTRVINFFDEDSIVDADHLAKIVRDVRPPKDNLKFRFYDAARTSVLSL